MKRYGYLLIWLTALLAGVSVLASTSAQRKSRHYMLRAMQSEIEREWAEAQELYRYAYRLDPSNKWAGYQVGISSMVSDDSVTAQKGRLLVEDYLHSNPDDYTLAHDYAAICTFQGETAKAYSVLRGLYERFPEKAELLNSLERLSLELDKPDSCLYYIELDERLNGASPMTTAVSTIAYFLKQDTVGAERKIDAMLAAHPDEYYYYLLKGNIKEKTQGVDSALHYALLADSLFPGTWDVKQALIDAYEQKGDSLAKERTMYEALMVEDADIEDKLQLLNDFAAPIVMHSKDTKTADALLTSLEEMYPYEPEVRSFSARYAAAKGELSRAVDQMRVAVDMEPTNPDYATSLVQYLVGTERYDEALENYLRIPKQEEPQIFLELLGAGAYQGAKRYTEGLALIDSIVGQVLPGVNPDSITRADMYRLNDQGISLMQDVLGTRANILYLMGETQRGLDGYAFAVELDTTNVITLNNYAYFLAKATGDLDKAEHMSRKTIEAEPDNAVYIDTYAYILFRQGKYDEAIGYMEKALAKCEEEGEGLSYEYYEHYGDMLFKAGQRAKALEQWKKALRLEPDRKILKEKIRKKTYIDE